MRYVIALMLLVWSLIGLPAAAVQWDRYIDISDERLSRTTCTVKGEVRNRTSMPLDVQIEWRAYDGADILVGTASARVYPVPADGRQVFESATFVFYFGQFLPCHRVVRFERSAVQVYGE